MGCSAAINLDGGGSSTLYIDGEYINETIGDSDEGAGRKVIRPVSDAIVFKSRSWLLKKR
jgi:exopolysaccharide biosynthesis protein